MLWEQVNRTVDVRNHMPITLNRLPLKNGRDDLGLRGILRGRMRKIDEG